MGVIVEGIPRGYQGLFTSVSLGYPLSVFNKTPTLKPLLSEGSLRPKGFTTQIKLSKDFHRSNESHFRRKIPVIIVPNFETGVNNCVPCDVYCFSTKL